MKLQTTMPVIEVPVNLGQTLSDVEQIYPLPTNGIFHKILPGLGATHGEINSQRHSIIVLPNVPVIKGKVAKHNKENSPEKRILGVYKGISASEITEYLSDDTVLYKKVLITPESYDRKLKPALAEIFDYIKQTYYLLIDECERTIQDVGFREKITAPFDDFFSFTNKGLISATTLPFSDPEFENDFAHYVIKPMYDYRKPLVLLHTNNVVAAMRSYFERQQGQTYFIFLSSIKTITALIDALNIKSQSKIHCSESRRTELKFKGYKAESDLDTNSLAKYNFLTSRFYSAVDIILDYKPDVVMLTEVIFAEHSILDPLTEVIQITGRFRNGANSLTHITNVNPEIAVKTEEQIRVYMDGQKDVYLQILNLKKTMGNNGAQEAIEQILTKSDFSRYFKPNGSYNWFMLDNYIQEQRVLGLYKSLENLTAAYGLVKKHFTLDIQTKNYPLSDKDRLKLASAESKKELIKAIVHQLKRLTPTVINYVFGGEDLLNDLYSINPTVCKAYRIIKEEGIIKADYSEAKIKVAMEEAQKESALNSPELLSDIKSSFVEGKFYTEADIISILQAIFDKHGINQRIRAGRILKYFKADRTTRNKKKGYAIGGWLGVKQ